jgi:hypothetical protein
LSDKTARNKQDLTQRNSSKAHGWNSARQDGMKLKQDETE